VKGQIAITVIAEIISKITDDYNYLYFWWISHVCTAPTVDRTSIRLAHLVYSTKNNKLLSDKTTATNVELNIPSDITGNFEDNFDRANQQRESTEGKMVR